MHSCKNVARHVPIVLVNAKTLLLKTRKLLTKSIKVTQKLPEINSRH